MHGLTGRFLLMLKRIFSLFKQPDDFEGYPYGLLTNQMSHIGISTLVSSSILFYFGVNWLILIVGFWLLWETYQLIYRDAKISDMFADLLFECAPVGMLYAFEYDLEKIIIGHFVLLAVLLAYVIKR